MQARIALFIFFGKFDVASHLAVPFFFFLLITLHPAQSQTPIPIYSVTAGNGNGIRFWESDLWKMHMGIGTEYAFGPVNDYSIKLNMDATPGRGWTWGHTGSTPIAALSNIGQMKIASHFESNGNIVSYRASTGYLALSGDLPGSPDGLYPTLKTNTQTIHFSVEGKYSAYLSGADPKFGLVNNNNSTGVLLNSAGNSFFLGGNVGIGNSGPTAKLDVTGAGNSTVDVKVNGRIQTGDSWGNGGVWLNSASTMFVGQLGSSDLGLYNGDWRLVVNNAGKVGIGTRNPDEKLTVKGKVHAEEVIIDLSVPAPDYVFEKDYSLTSLDEVRAYVAHHKHLPGVPSAQEMERDGVRVGEMEMILLKKIEELTLYAIDSNELIKSLAEENKSQRSELLKLAKEIESLKSKK